MDAATKKKIFLERLMATFRVEAGEHIKAITSGLIQLEKSGDPRRQEQIIEAMYREAHSLKGASRSVDCTAIESICQALESVLRKFKHGGFSALPGVFDVLHRAVDLIDNLIAAGTQSTPEDADILNMVLQLAGLEKDSPVFTTNATGNDENEEQEKLNAGPGTDKKDDSKESRENRRQILEAIEARRLQKKRDRRATERITDNVPRAPFIAGTVRVSVAKLDGALLQAEELIFGKIALNRLAGELANIREELEVRRKKTDAISPQGIKQLVGKLWEVSRSLENDRRSLGAIIDNHLADMKSLLVMPFSILTEGFPKVVRDLARAKGKEVDIIIEGAESEINKRVLEEIKDPLLHLLRNAVDHGIETPQVRMGKNKPAGGTIRMAISVPESNKVAICLSDDGAGINLEKVKEKITGAGLVTAENLQKLTDLEILDMIFRSEISTAPLIGDISGRGLGLPIAREKVEKLGGLISVTTEVDKGTTFCIALPLVMGAFRGMLVKAGAAKFIIPITDVDRSLRVRPGDIKTVENRETILVDGRAISHIALADVLKSRQEPQILRTPEFIQVLLLSAEGKEIAFSVDGILDEEEVLVKSLGRQLRRVINISGAVILGSSEVVPILNVPDLIKSAIKMSGSGGAAASKKKAKAVKTRSVLLVEDSITSRVLLKNIMEAAGYRVFTAVDGLEGWASLQRQPVDIVVSDVDMPRMDGFQLTAHIRADKKLADIPVVLVSGLEAGVDREKGIEVGANAYIVKSNFDRENLLAVLKKIL